MGVLPPLVITSWSVRVSTFVDGVNFVDGINIFLLLSIALLGTVFTFQYTKAQYARGSSAIILKVLHLVLHCCFRQGTMTFQALSDEDRRLWLDAMDGKEPVSLSLSYCLCVFLCLAVCLYPEKMGWGGGGGGLK